MWYEHHRSGVIARGSVILVSVARRGRITITLPRPAFGASMNIERKMSLAHSPSIQLRICLGLGFGISRSTSLSHSLSLNRSWHFRDHLYSDYGVCCVCMWLSP